MTAIVTADRDDERSQQEFLLAERAPTYFEYINAVEESRLLMQPFMPPGLIDITRAIWPLEPYAHPGSSEQIAKIQEANQSVTTATGKISLIGGDVAPLAEELKKDLIELQSFIERVHECHTRNPESGRCQEVLEAPGFDQSRTKMLLSHERFQDAAQRQLNASN